ncbi:hypothetical protein Lfu02_17920 [Longispora fulva]|uniref:Uncharacterized protein n=1 Tax=Longispora fulva TaxID=619741 RepID=A0A8J7H0E3_9ACTN|nr:hypothetical protein [Longispora fulva]MBG6140203.1 hypothetical protein [Longispora fulva]GIG57420.1 hypothetical protein Lfu02_17920 [Longispora fulva]
MTAPTPPSPQTPPQQTPQEPFPSGDFTTPQHPPRFTPPPVVAQQIRKNRRKTLIGVAVLVVTVIGFYVMQVLTGAPDLAKVGQCATGHSTDGRDFKTVDCADPAAEWRIVGKVKYNYGIPADQICKDFPTAENTYEKTGRNSYTLCLEPLKK